MAERPPATDPGIVSAVTMRCQTLVDLLRGKTTFPLDVWTALLPLWIFMASVLVSLVVCFVPLGNPRDGHSFAYAFFVWMFSFGTTCVPCSWFSTVLPGDVEGFQAIPPLMQLAGQIIASVILTSILSLVFSFAIFPLPYGIFVILVGTIIVYEPFILMPMIMRRNAALKERPEVMARTKVILENFPKTIAPAILLQTVFVAIYGTVPGFWKNVCAALLPFTAIALSNYSIMVFDKIDHAHAPLGVVIVGSFNSYLKLVVLTDSNLGTAIYFIAFEVLQNLSVLVRVRFKLVGLRKRFFGTSGSTSDGVEDAAFEEDLELGMAVMTALMHEVFELMTTPLRLVQVLLFYYLSPNLRFMAGLGIGAYGNPSVLDDQKLSVLMNAMLASYVGDFIVFVSSTIFMTYVLHVDLKSMYLYFCKTYFWPCLVLMVIATGLFTQMIQLLHTGVDFSGDLWHCIEPEASVPICPKDI